MLLKFLFLAIAAISEPAIRAGFYALRKVRRRSIDVIEAGGEAKRYKAVFHSGAQVDLQTKALKGVAELGASGLKVFGNESRTEIPAQSILDASLQAIPGGGHMVKVERAQGTLFVGAREFMVGQLASFNSQETRDLLEGVLLLAERNRPSSQR